MNRCAVRLFISFVLLSSLASLGDDQGTRSSKVSPAQKNKISVTRPARTLLNSASIKVTSRHAVNEASARAQAGQTSPAIIRNRNSAAATSKKRIPQQLPLNASLRRSVSARRSRPLSAGSSNSKIGERQQWTPQVPRLYRSTDRIMRMRSITNAQRARAAKNARARYAAAIIAQRAATPKMAQAVSRAAITSGFPFAMNPADLYFGVNPNYAFSPLPIGSVGAITVTDVGSGYVDPVVTITDAYVMPAIPASATATVTGGAVTSINILNLGSGYIAPVVTITDNLGAGATATASLDPQTVSGGIRKFVDSMPGICGVAGGTNALGQCLPLAVPDAATYPGSDFYQIGLSDYTQKMHSDLPATHLRGYYDLNAASPVHQYLGPVIIAERNRPVRVLFKNLLPTSGTLDSNGTDLSKLLIPMDSTYMGAGKGPTALSTHRTERSFTFMAATRRGSATVPHING